MGSTNSQLAPHPEGKTMKAVVFQKYGKPETLTRISVPVPHAGFHSGDLLIRVHAASVNPVDKIFLKGDMKMLKPVAGFPHVIGYDAAGVVEIADQAGTFAVGDEVMVRLFGPDGEDKEKKTPYFRGACAEYCVAQAKNCAKKPANITFEEAASIPLAGMTALQCLSATKKGDRVLITGGAGGVGTLAIQLAKHVYGASFVATTASPGEKTELCKSLGADQVVDYRSEKFDEVFAEAPFDICFDTTGESLQMANVIKEGGKIVTIAGTPTLESIKHLGGTGFIISLVIPKKAKRKEYQAATAKKAEWDHVFLRPSGEDIQALATHLEQGKIKAVVDGVWDLHSQSGNESVSAYGDLHDPKASWQGVFEKLFSGRAKGKCVLKCFSEETTQVPKMDQEKNELASLETALADSSDASAVVEAKTEPEAVESGL